MVELREGSALLHLVRSGPTSESAGSGPESRDTGRGAQQSRRPGPRATSGRSAGRSAGRGPGPPASPEGPAPRASHSAPREAEAVEPTTCGFCGKEFVEDRSQATCQACPLSKKGCGLMRCPHCGYENAKEPGWLSWIKERIA